MANERGTQVAAGLEKEPWTEQAASFIGFFIYLLVLKSFFLPLFMIPTGSMAPTLYGAHSLHTCSNCTTNYAVGWQPGPPELQRPGGRFQPAPECPNCRWREQHVPTGAHPTLPLDSRLPTALRASAGDRIFVHGWTYDWPFRTLEGFGPQRWDVVVFKVPTDGQTNYIKRLVGLPGETLEIIDGDIFVHAPDGARILRKTADAQQSLWFEYYNQDRPPKEPAQAAGYFPRWFELGGAGLWSGVDTRVFRFPGAQGRRATLQFITTPQLPVAASDAVPPGLIQDIYGYNDPRPGHFMHVVSDVRLSAEVDYSGRAGESSYLELSLAHEQPPAAAHTFRARLSADGRIALTADSAANSAAPDEPSEPSVTRREADLSRLPGGWPRPVRFALAHVDGRVQVEIDGHLVAGLQTDAEYQVTPEIARARARAQRSPRVQITATGEAPLTLRHVLLERDVYYTRGAGAGADERIYPHGVESNPVQLGPDEYFVLGDNSPSSADARIAFIARPGQEAVGPHLKDRFASGAWRPGRVPRDQLIGRAFFVYWPGTLPLTRSGPNVLPNLGRARWIH